MASRLQDLLRQRALIQEHVRWLDEEIAREKGPEPSTQISATNLLALDSALRAPGNPPAESDPSPHEGEDPADDLLAQYQKDPHSLRQTVRQGCLLYCGLGLALVIGIILLIHHAYPQRP